MTTIASPAPLTRSTSRTARTARLLRRPLRILVAVVLLAIVAAGVYWNEAYRSFEAMLASLTLGPFIGGAGSSGTTFFLAQDQGLIGLVITAECTALILIAPLVVLAAVLLVFTRASWARIFTGIALMWVIVTVVNEVRLALIGFASSVWGTDVGYPISHTYVGSVVGILGFVAGLAALLITAGTVRRRQR